MKKNVLLFLLFLLFFSCSTSKNPMNPVGVEPEKIDFSQSEIHYRIVNGWSSSYTLDVFSDGAVIAKELQHANAQTVLDSAYTTLTDDEKKEISELFGYFQYFDYRYLPEEIFTDLDDHLIIFFHQDKADTVHAYMPGSCQLPDQLRFIFNELQNRMFSMLKE